MPSLLGAALLAPEAVLFAERDEPFRRDHRRPRTAPRSKTTSRAPAPEDTFFRIVKGATPALSDFYSHRRLFGAKARPWNVSAEEWDSISMFQRRADARRQALATPAIGTHIAVVDLRQIGRAHV